MEFSQVCVPTKGTGVMAATVMETSVPGTRIQSREVSERSTPRDKYFLRDLHQEIDLYDRKLAYLDKFVHFASPADREDAQQRLLARRATVMTMADGVKTDSATCAEL